MVDCKSGIYDVFYNELVCELPAFDSVDWDNIVESFKAHTSAKSDNPWSSWLKKPSQANLDKVL